MDFITYKGFDDDSDEIVDESILIGEKSVDIFDYAQESESVSYSKSETKKSKHKEKSRKRSKNKEKSSSNEINIEDFEVPKNNHMCFLGKTQSGKTNLIRAYCKYNSEKFDLIFLFSPNEHKEVWLDREFRYHIIEFAKIIDIWTFARNNNGKYSILVIIDDPVGTDFHHGSPMSEMITRCRHDNVTLLISMQYINTVPPCIRDNMSHYIICHANKNTVDALQGLTSSDVEWRDFQKFVCQAKVGRAVYLNLVPGQRELNYLTSNECKNFKIE